MSILSTTDITKKSNKVDSVTSNSENWNNDQYPTAASVTALFNSTVSAFKPIGSIYETVDEYFDPNLDSYFGNSAGMFWEFVETAPKRLYVCSQVMHPGVTGTGVVGKTVLCGAYLTELLGPLYSRFTRAGYHMEVRFSTICYTGNNNRVLLYLNNTLLFQGGTWSNAEYRTTHVSDFINPANVAQTPAAGYTSNGYTLFYETTASTNGTYGYGFFDVTAHIYAVSDYETVYRWKRIA